MKTGQIVASNLCFGNDANAPGELSLVATPNDDLPEQRVEAYDVFLSFTRASTGAEEQAARLERALTHKGIRVFRDVRVDEFAGITRELIAALAASKVLLAYYTREYPTRYACQWELTAAFVAAQREGDPRRRVLLVNPESSEDHIHPIELADAKYVGTPDTDAKLDQLVTRIIAHVATLRGPLGAAPHPVDHAHLPAEVLAPRLLVGRYPEMWNVHTHLHAMDLPGVHEPAPEPVVVITGLPGIGKTSVAARYAYLYRDAYPGGVFWTGSFGTDPQTFLWRFTDQLRRIADEQLGLQVQGVEPDRLRTMIAAALSRARHKVLWIVDDVPPALPADVLRRVLVPAHNVRSIVTSQAHVRNSAVPEIRLSGLGDGEVRQLLGVSTANEIRAAREFAGRCGGHPIVVLAAANELRYRAGPVTPDMVPELLHGAASEVGTALDGAVAEVDPLARQVLRVAGILASAPFPPALVHSAVNATEMDLANAAQMLVRRGLMHLVGADWSVHPLVSSAAGASHALSEHVATALLAPRAGDSVHLSEHALRLGMNPHVGIATRRRLLRVVVAGHEAKGDPVAAAVVASKLLDLTDADKTPVNDLLAAARAQVACGRSTQAERTARQALDNAAVTDDFKARHRARLLLAEALDQLGDHGGADEVCWTDLADHLPGWLRTDNTVEERVRTQLALASAKMARGAARDALAIVEPIVTQLRAAPPGPLRDDLAPMASLSLAQLWQLTGRARAARDLAAEVIQHYRDNGMSAHARLLEAEGIWADAFLTLDLTELDGTTENWQRSERKLRELATRYAEQWGDDSAVAVAARVRAERALIALGRPRDALRALAEVETFIADRLGEHRLLYRVRHAIGQAHGQLREFTRQRDLLEKVVPAQITLLGRYHPETLESGLDLGIACAMTGDSAKAKALVDEAAAGLRRVLGTSVDLTGKATTAQMIVRLPFPVLKTMAYLDRLF